MNLYSEVLRKISIFRSKNFEFQMFKNLNCSTTREIGVARPPIFLTPVQFSHKNNQHLSTVLKGQHSVGPYIRP